jgi:hypothetical protein
VGRIGATLVRPAKAEMHHSENSERTWCAILRRLNLPRARAVGTALLAAYLRQRPPRQVKEAGRLLFHMLRTWLGEMSRGSQHARLTAHESECPLHPMSSLMVDHCGYALPTWQGSAGGEPIQAWAAVRGLEPSRVRLTSAPSRRRPWR